MKDKWNSRSVYVVGKATAALGKTLTLEVLKAQRRIYLRKTSVNHVTSVISDLLLQHKVVLRPHLSQTSLIRSRLVKCQTY